MAWQAQVMALWSRQQYAEALQVCEGQWLRAMPGDAQAMALAGVLCYALGRWPQALAYQQRVLQGDVPTRLRADTLTNMALSLSALHRRDEAAQAYRDSLALVPEQAKAWNNLGNLLAHAPARRREALACYERALALQAVYPNAWTNLGFARAQLQDKPGALRAYEQALAQDATYVPALRNAAELLEADRPLEALALYRRALAVSPNDLGLVASAVSLRRVLADWSPTAGPDVADVVALASSGDHAGVAPLHWMAWLEVSAGLLRDQARAFARSRWAAALAQPPLCDGARSRAGRRLRVGYLSPDFRNHPVTHLVSGVIAAHDRQRVEVFLYAYGDATADDYTQALQAAVEHWCGLSALDDAQAAQRIHADGIDVLVDLAGFTTHARLGITALRPAPVVVSWIGYVGSLGEPRLADYILADEVVMPKHLHHGLSEQVAYLSPCFQPNAAWQPVALTSTRAQEGLPEQGLVLCSFNQTFKITPQLWDAWCAMLRGVPGSVLWLAAPRHAQAVEHFRREMQLRGIAPARLCVARRVPLAQHWGRIALADLALDTFPYNSGTTASDALRCGVPLLTCAGDTFASRMAASLLSALGLQELITTSTEAYVQRALEVLGDPVLLAGLRQRLASALPESVVFKPEHMARQLEDVFERMAGGQTIAPARSAEPAPPARAPDGQALAHLSQRYSAFMAQGQFAQALAVAQEALTLAPEVAGVVGDAGLAHLRLGDYEQARRSYAQASAMAPEQVNWLDGLCEACGHLGLMSEARAHGLKALAMKDAQTQAQTVWPLPPRLPPLSAERRRNVIAFSLFGQSPRYCEGAKLNVQAAQAHLPQWLCRFYVDATVPDEVCTALQEMGAQLVRVNEADARELSGLMWRFLVLEDEGVDRFLLRDADAIISAREAAAVEAWLRSDRAFHLMRDYFTHTELLLAGMWGGCGGVFNKVRERMREFIQHGKYLGARVVDQHFLRAHIWPTVRQSVLSHDSVFGFMSGQDFPPHAPLAWGEGFHVGCNMASSAIGADGLSPDCGAVVWTLHNEHGELVCRYRAQVSAGSWRADLPSPYTDQIKAGRWQVRYEQAP